MLDTIFDIFRDSSQVSIKDFPKLYYTAYYDYCVGCDGDSPEAGVMWRYRVYDYATGDLLKSEVGTSKDKEAAKAKVWLEIRKNMNKYRRK